MLLYLDIDSRRILSTPTRAISRLELKRRDNDTLEIVFLREGIVQQLPAGTTARVGIKTENDYASEFLAVTSLAQTGTGTSTVYSGEINLNTTAMAAAFAEEPATLAAMFEVEWTSGTALSSSRTLPVSIANDVIRGDEGEPAELPVFYTAETIDFQATQAQAESGTDNATWMSPLRTAQAIAASGAGPHTHPLSEIEQSGATVGQVPRWDGTAWAPATPSTGGGGGGGVTSYNDLTDKPSLGTAAATAASDYATAAQGAKADSASQPGHTHSAADILSGTLDIARIPTGTTTSTVCLGNDSRLSDSRTPTAHTHGNITNLGAIGTTSGVPVITGASGVLQAGAFGTSSGRFAEGNHTHTFGTTAGTYCQGNDSRLLNLTGGITAIAVVATMPATPSATTLYIVTT